MREKIMILICVVIIALIWINIYHAVKDDLSWKPIGLKHIVHFIWHGE